MQVTIDEYGRVTSPEVIAAIARHQDWRRNGSDPALCAWRLKQEALQAHRERVILQILNPFESLRIGDLHDRFVRACAERGWPAVGAPRLRQIVDTMARAGRVRTEVRSYGRKGRMTIVYARPPASPQADFVQEDAKEVSVERR